MITTRHRFHGLGSLRATYRNSKTVRVEGCSLRHHPNPKRKSYRLAVVVSKKTNKSAVVRNRIRRRIYENIRNIEPQIKSQQDMIITVHDDAYKNMPAKTLQSRITELLKKADII